MMNQIKAAEKIRCRHCCSAGPKGGIREHKMNLLRERHCRSSLKRYNSQNSLSISIVISFILIIGLALLSGIGLAQIDPGELKSYSSPDGYYFVSLPDGWKVDGFKCAGIFAQDLSNPARGMVYLCKLHEGIYMLPSGVIPESYLENYLAADFSLGANQVGDMRMEGYEVPGFYSSPDVDALLQNQASLSSLVSAKAMRCTFLVNDVPAAGSFLVVTRELYGIGTTVDYLLGFYAPVDQFDEDAPALISAFNSVKLNPAYRNICIPPAGGECIECLDSDCCSHECDMQGYCR